jgi:hypothetical protein
MLNEKASGAFPNFQGKISDKTSAPSSGVHVGGTRLGPLFEIYVIKFCTARFGIADTCRDNAITAY